MKQDKQNVELCKKIKHAFYCGGKYPELTELHALFDLMDSFIDSEEKRQKEILDTETRTVPIIKKKVKNVTKRSPPRT